MTQETESNDYTKSLTAEQVLELHSLATAAMPYMRFIFNLTENQLWEAFKALPPEHTKAMATTHNMLALINQMRQNTNGVLLHGERVLAELARQNDPVEKEKRKLNDQGFGLIDGRAKQ